MTWTQDTTGLTSHNQGCGRGDETLGGN